MQSFAPGFSQINVDDLQFLIHIGRYNSLRIMACDRNDSPPNLSKRIRRLESILGQPIIQRSVKGIQLTPFGGRVVKAAEKVLDGFAWLDANLGPERSNIKPTTIASRAFLNSFFAGDILGRVEVEQAHRSLYFIDLSPAEIMMAARAGTIDCAIYTDDLDLGKAWRTHLVGHLHWRLYARVGHPALSPIPGDKPRRWQVLGQVFWDGHGMVNPDPVGFAADDEVLVAHRVHTAAAAVAVLRRTDCVALLPDIVASEHVLAGTLARVPTSSFAGQSSRVFLGVHQDRVPDSLFRLMRDGLSFCFSRSLS